MKFKIITLVFILLISCYGFSDGIYLTGGLTFAPETQATSFYSRDIKIQPGAAGGAFFHINFNDIAAVGLTAEYIYNFSSDLNGGWSYPGFSGMETGIDLRFAMPFMQKLEIGAAGIAGWYRYNLTENHFFLPSVAIYPALLIYDNRRFRLYAELPVKYYFHKQADLFMSAGIKLRAVFQ